MENRSGGELIETRVLRLEERLDRMEERGGGRARGPHPAWAFSFGLAALASGYQGMGLPNHVYQVLFAGLLMLMAYHRGSLRTQEGRWLWPQAVINFLVLCLLLKLLIGAGTGYPFGWLKVPVIVKAPQQQDGSWFGTMIPDMSVQWQGIPKVSDWGIDITKAQTFLLIATLAGALFRFQPFASLTALVLLIISIPSYAAYNWDGVVLFLVLCSVSLYLQTGTAAGTRRTV